MIGSTDSLRRGINYDIGTVVNEYYMSRPVFDLDTVRKELRIIRDDLHCNAIRISGTDPNRLITAAKIALELELEVWLSPQIHDKSRIETLRYITDCAMRAETLRQENNHIIFILGCELTWFMQDIMPGSSFERRIVNPINMMRLRYGKAMSRKLNIFLGQAAAEVRKVFQGSLTYASAPIEAVNWELFDYICLDYYRGAKNKDDYGKRLERHFNYSKPVIITEVGLCTYRGAEDKGGRGFAITDTSTGKLEVKPGFIRDEALQASELSDMLNILIDRNISGIFVFTFESPVLTHDPKDPIHDLDLASFSIVKALGDQHGRRYPEMHWEPKKAFDAVARIYSLTPK